MFCSCIYYDDNNNKNPNNDINNTQGDNPYPYFFLEKIHKDNDVIFIGEATINKLFHQVATGHFPQFSTLHWLTAAETGLWQGPVKGGGGEQKLHVFDTIRMVKVLLLQGDSRKASHAVDTLL